MAGRRKMGRRAKLTRDLIAQIEQALRLHNSHKHTCELIGISRQTFYRWMALGEGTEEGGKKIHRDFYDKVKKAQGQSVAILVNDIAKDPAWQAKAWLLERLHPHEFGRKAIVEIGGRSDADAPPIEHRHQGKIETGVTIVIENSRDTWQESDDPTTISAEFEEIEATAAPQLVMPTDHDDE